VAKFLDKMLSWVGYAVDKVRTLRDRIQRGVTEAHVIALVAARALDKYGDKLAALEPEDLAWFFGPVTTAIAAAQENAIITGAVGKERLEAVRLALLLAKAGVDRADAAFDAQWERVNPHIEAFIAQAKSDRVLAFGK
jgi:hypothetical protein